MMSNSNANANKQNKHIAPKEKYPEILDYKEELVNLNYEKDNELRIELGIKDVIKITLVSGTAEIEGSEIPLNIPVYKKNQNFAIFSWETAEIKIQGSFKTKYISKSNTMSDYLIAHQLINNHRQISQSRLEKGPIILIVGSKFSGKTTLCHILCNYSLRFGWKPIYVDLDLKNEIAIPGTISATLVDYNLPNDLLLENAITIFHGYKNSEILHDLYEKQITELSSFVKTRIEGQIQTFKNEVNYNEVKLKQLKESYNQDVFLTPSTSSEFASGVIINCLTIKDDNKWYLYKKVIDVFDCDYVFVLDNEKLCKYLEQYAVEKSVERSYKPMKRIQVTKLEKSGGVIDRRSRDNFNQIRFNVYFDGPCNNYRYNEHTISLKDYKLLKLYPTNLKNEMLTIGETMTLKIIIREIGKNNYREENLVNKILSIPSLDAKILDDLETNFDGKLNKYLEEFAKSTAAYFAIIKQVDMIEDNLVLKIYTPLKQLDKKNRYFIIGNIKYSD